MTRNKSGKSPQSLVHVPGAKPAIQPTLIELRRDFSQVDRLPASYQEVYSFLQEKHPVDLAALRWETILRIERLTKIPLMCFVARTQVENLPEKTPIQIDHSDITGFDDLIHSVDQDQVDVFIVSNGGSAEATERIVRMLRSRFNSVRFIVPNIAYSALTLMCMSGDRIIMGLAGTLGPIDPQLSGIPARTILRAFENLEQRLKSEGPGALTAYMPMLDKYGGLHILEMCRSAELLSIELARNWLSNYMLKCESDDPRVETIVNHFASYDTHKSHARSIDRIQARELGLEIIYSEEIDGLADLIRSLYSQYEILWNNSPFYKIFEDGHGNSWGRMLAQQVQLQITPKTFLEQN